MREVFDKALKSKDPYLIDVVVEKEENGYLFVLLNFVTDLLLFASLKPFDISPS